MESVTVGQSGDSPRWAPSEGPGDGRGGRPCSGRPPWRPASSVCGGLCPRSVTQHLPRQSPCPAGTQMLQEQGLGPTCRPHPVGPTQGCHPEAEAPLALRFPRALGGLWGPWAACLR